MTAVGRARGAILGLAVGDALGAPTEGLTPDVIREQFGRIDDFVDADAAGTDDTEYAVLCGRGLLRYGHDMTPDDVAAVWDEHVTYQQGGFYGAGFSETSAISNLQSGLRPPHSGSDNYEFFSDGAAMRAAPIGVFCAGDPDEAARLAAVDAQISHAADGIWCAQAVAAAVAVALVTDNPGDVLAEAVRRLPTDSWSHRTAREALAIAEQSCGLDDAVGPLFQEIPVFAYPWADAAPEALALALGIFAAGSGQFSPCVLASVNLGRDSDTIAAIVGALSGALHGEAAIPAAWQKQVRYVRGRCITLTAGTDLVDLADRMAVGPHPSPGPSQRDRAGVTDSDG